MTCDEVRDRIHVDEVCEAAVYDHIADCRPCREFARQRADEKEAFRAFGASIAPRRNLWLPIATRIANQRRRARLGMLTVAATVGAVIVAAVVFETRRRGEVEHFQPPQPISNAVVKNAEQRYRAAFALLNREQASMDKRVDNHVLKELDAAIAALRAAVVATPDDPRVVARWRAACDRKVDLLRAAVESGT
jgi:hypothetical protein